MGRDMMCCLVMCWGVCVHVHVTWRSTSFHALDGSGYEFIVVAVIKVRD